MQNMQKGKAEVEMAEEKKESSLAIIPERYIEMAREDFTVISPAMNFQKEFHYAMQMVTKTKFSMDCFKAKPESLRNAIINVAGVGLSLNPAEKLAYLVPRDNQICLDVSYMGLLKLAQMDGAILWGQARPVRANDIFKLRGFDQEPIHEYDYFATAEERGALRGFYCVVKTVDGSYLTTIMSLEQIHKIRARSSSYKAFLDKKVTTPWETDYEEMCCKTVIKRAYKTWPKAVGSRLAKAIEVLNEHEGIDFEAEKKIRVIDESERLLDNALNPDNKPAEKPKPTPKQVELVKEILDSCKKLCEAYTTEEKMKFMQDDLDIKSKFEELYEKSEEKLAEIENKLKLKINPVALPGGVQMPGWDEDITTETTKAQ